MEVRFINDFSSGYLYESWNDILSQVKDANAQLTYEWISSCWDVFGGDKRLALIVVEDKGKIVGIAPLAVTTVISKAGLRLRKLAFIGDGLTDYQDLLMAEDKRQEVLYALFEFIFNAKQEWDAIHFRNMRGDSPNLPILRNIFGDTPFRFVERINIRSPYISIDCKWSDYYNTLGKNMKSDIKRRLNGLARAGKAEFVRLHELDDVAQILNIIKSIHVKCRQSKGGISWYTNGRRFELASLILRQFSNRKWLDLVFLKLNDRIIAYYLGFIYNSIVHFWNTGFDPEYSHVSPGKLLLHYWIKDSFEKGYKQFDFMVGEEPYKFQWTSLVRPNYELFLFRNTARSSLLKCYYDYKPVLKKNPYLRKIGAGIKSRIHN